MIGDGTHTGRIGCLTAGPEVVREITVASGGVTYRIVLDGRTAIRRRSLGVFKGTAGSCAVGLDLLLEESVRTVRYLEFLRSLPAEPEVAVTAWSGSVCPPSVTTWQSRALSVFGRAVRRTVHGTGHIIVRHIFRNSPARSTLAACKWEETVTAGGEPAIRLLGRKRPGPTGAVLLVMDRPILSADRQLCGMALRLRHGGGSSESVLLGNCCRSLFRQAERHGSVWIEEVTGPWSSMAYEAKVDRVSPAPRLLEVLGCQCRQ